MAEVDQRDWDEYAERITFAINTPQGRIRGDTSFYLIHGWDPRSRLEATLSVGNTGIRDRDPKRWGYKIQRQYQRAQSAVNDHLRVAIQEREDRHNEDLEPHKVEVGTQVWLYLDQVGTQVWLYLDQGRLREEASAYVAWPIPSGGYVEITR